jgi:hypothetical protein
VTHSKFNTDTKECEVLVGSRAHLFDIDLMSNIEILNVFDDQVVKFLKKFSKELVKIGQINKLPDMVSMGFWLNQVTNETSPIYDKQSHFVYKGKGLLFHITPSNVPINFVYSLVLGLLTGNVNLVRLTSKPFEQITLVVQILNTLLSKEEFSHLRKFIFLVQYPHNQNLTDYFSSLCKVRIIWGSDETIQEIRLSSLSSHSVDIVFPDRYSMLIVNSSEYLTLNSSQLAQKFYNDTYLFDQNACTSPHLLIWVGSAEQNSQAKKVFWNSLEEVVKLKYNIEKIQSLDKLVTFQMHSAVDPSIRKQEYAGNRITVISLPTLDSSIVNLHSNSGYFMQYETPDLSCLKDFVTTKIQTVSYIGFSKYYLMDFIQKNSLVGIDRVVEAGKTLDFSLTWDGIDLLSTFSRRIEFN